MFEQFVVEQTQFYHRWDSYNIKNIQFSKNTESPMMSDNKSLYICQEWTLIMNTQTIFRKELILLAFRGQNYYHRIKYIIFKSSSSKYNEVSHYHLYLIR